MGQLTEHATWGQSVKTLNRSRSSENMSGLILVLLVAAAATSLVEAEEEAPETAGGEEGEDLEGDYLDGDEEEEEDYDYDPEGEDDTEWPEEWGDPELDDSDSDEPHGGEL